MTQNWAKILFCFAVHLECQRFIGTAKPNEGSYLYQFYNLFLIPNSGN